MQKAIPQKEWLSALNEFRFYGKSKVSNPNSTPFS
jgi:hypothetical protein